MKKFQLPRFKDHVGLGETPKYKSYLLRLHEEDANNDEEEIFETKPRELCIERRVLPHPKKRMQLFLEDDEKRQLERNEVINSSSNNNNNNNTCSQIQCPSDVATAHIAFPVDRLDNMRQITPHQYPQSLSQIPVNHANFATSNCDLDSLKQRKFQKEIKMRNGFDAGYDSNPFSSHPICSPKHPPPFVSRHRPGHYYSKGKSIGKNIIDDRSSVQNTSGGDHCIDNKSHHPMNLPYLNPWMYPQHNVNHHNNEQEEKLLVGIQYNHKMFDDFILNKKEHHSLASPNAPISPDRHSEYILPQQQRHDEEISVLSESGSFCARGVNSAQDLRLPNSSRRLAQIINEVSCGKQAVLRQLVPLKSARQPAGDPALRRRPGLHEQDFWQNEHRKDGVHLPCDAEFGVDVPPHGLFPQCPGAPVPRHGDDVAVYPSHPSQHYGYGPPQQYMYEREDLQTNPTPAGTTAPSLSARDKTISWLSSGDSSSFTPYKPADAITSSTSNNTSSAKKSDDYRGRPMSTWEFRHVAHFLIEATHDLGIQYEDTDFSQLSKVNGQKLISMGPEHYEKFAPTQGQRIFDYVRRHRNHEVLTDGALDTCTESSPDVSSVRSIETPPVSFGAPTWPSVSDDTYSYYPPAETFPVENSFSNVKNQSSPTSSKVPSPYAPMSVETSLPTTSTFSDPFQFQEGSCSSDSAAKQQTHLVPTSLSTPYSTQSLMNSGPLLPPASVESTTSYHSQMLRPPTSSSGSHQDKSGLHDTIRPSSRMSAATSEIEESSDDDEDDGEGDDEEEEEEEEVEEKVVEEKPPEPPKKRGPGRPPKPESERKKKKKTGRLWEFIRNLLLNPETCPSIVKWEDPETGVFRFVQSEKVAERWGMRKNNKKMNYEKLSRAMRYYYKGKVFEPVLGRRLVYKFGVNAKGWKPNEGNFGE